MVSKVVQFPKSNICRSPIAEAVFKDLVKKRNLENQFSADSAAIIDYHLGKSPEKRTLATLNAHGITDYQHKVRQVSSADFEKFDYIFGMDDDNIGDLQSLEKKSKNPKAKIEYLGSYDPQGNKIIEDPYYASGTALFEAAFEQCSRCCNGFLDAKAKKS